MDFHGIIIFFVLLKLFELGRRVSLSNSIVHSSIMLDIFQISLNSGNKMLSSLDLSFFVYWNA